jgi:hypothetical protein
MHTPGPDSGRPSDSGRPALTHTAGLDATNSPHGSVRDAFDLPAASARWQP